MVGSALAVTHDFLLEAMLNTFKQLNHANNFYHILRNTHNHYTLKEKFVCFFSSKHDWECRQKYFWVELEKYCDQNNLSDVERLEVNELALNYLGAFGVFSVEAR